MKRVKLNPPTSYWLKHAVYKPRLASYKVSCIRPLQIVYLIYKNMVVSRPSIINYRKRYHIANSYGSIIEGVGSTGGLLEGVNNVAQMSGFPGYYLICFQHNSDLYPSTTTSCSSSFGIPESQQPSWDLFPNPVAGILTIKSESDLNSISFYNMLGNIILEIQGQGVEQSVDVSIFPKGIYIVRIGTSHRKFIKD